MLYNAARITAGWLGASARRTTSLAPGCSSPHRATPRSGYLSRAMLRRTALTNVQAADSSEARRFFE